MTKALAAVVAVLAIATGYLYVQKPAPVVYGAVSTASSINSPVINVNGMAEYWNAQSLQPGTTTVCAIQSPNATSTLGKATLVWNGTTTASVATFASAPNRFASTTIIGSTVAIASGAQAVILSSTTAAQDGANTSVFGPNTWLTVSLSGATAWNVNGACTANFRQLTIGS